MLLHIIGTGVEDLLLDGLGIAVAVVATAVLTWRLGSGPKPSSPEDRSPDQDPAARHARGRIE
jgi:hypothetical protein